MKSDCTAQDQEYAIVVPTVKVLGGKTGVSKRLVDFDMYLTPKDPSQDYIVWERRSKVVGQRKLHRYQLTQILDKFGRVSRTVYLLAHGTYAL